MDETNAYQSFAPGVVHFLNPEFHFNSGAWAVTFLPIVLRTMGKKVW